MFDSASFGTQAFSSDAWYMGVIDPPIVVPQSISAGGYVHKAYPHKKKRTEQQRRNDAILLLLMQ